MKSVLISGINGGIGRSVTKKLLEEGYLVIGIDINIDDFPYEEVKLYKADITNKKDLLKIKEDIIKNNKLDAIINLTGISKMASLIEGDPYLIVKNHLEVNLLGMVNINSIFFPLLKKNSIIINFSSECGYLKTMPFNAPYSISKYGVESYTDSLRRELLYHDIKVVKIAPGSFKTKMHDNAYSAFEDLLKNTKYYYNFLNHYRKIIDKEMEKSHDPELIGNLISKVLKTNNPKPEYKIKTSKFLRLLELVPNIIFDKALKRRYDKYR